MGRQRLTGQLMNLLLTAERANNQAMHGLELERGGLVEVRIRGEMFTLRVSRAGILPSAAEWLALVQALPEAYKPLHRMLPSDFDENGRKYLSCSWPVRKREHRMIVP